MNYCPLDDYVLEEKILVDKMIYYCENCGYQRDLEAQETLLFEKHMAGYSGATFNAEDIVRHKINHRFPINCKCGSRVGILYLVGTESRVIAVCEHCRANVDYN
jgi:DNA-directed RNA polymerase subunit RPC12/RpoP